METFSDEEDISDLDNDQPLISLHQGKGLPPSSDEEEEVYGILSSGDESSAENDQVDEVTEDIRSDIEDEEKGGLPDSRAWGHKRKNFYDADYVDTNVFHKDPEAAELEEQEARDIQERLAEQLDAGTSFSLEMLAFQTGQAAAEVEEKLLEKSAEVVGVDEKIATDLSKLSKRQKLDLMRKESPEFFGLVNDFKERMREVSETWQPMMRLISEGKVKSPLIEQLVHTISELILNYCTHIGFYLLLKSKKIPVRTHPVIKRLCQLQELLKSLSVASESLSFQVGEILKMAAAGQDVNLQLSEDIDVDEIRTKNASSKKKLLSVLGKRKGGGNQVMDNSDGEAEEERVERRGVGASEGRKEGKVVSSSLRGPGQGRRDSRKHVTFVGDEEEGNLESNVGDGDMDIGVVEEENDLEDGEKRAITYQMAKNKGLTPRRKKEMRNPRVKHRNRFRKAKIRRKGQVREVLSEANRYGGEISGIKASVSKSIKIK